MSAIVLPRRYRATGMPRSSATGSDLARLMKRRTPHAAPRSWPLAAAIGAASSANARAISHQHKRPELDPINATRARRGQIPIAPAAPSLLTSRGFIPWRLSDTGPGVCRTVALGRHPKPFTIASLRNE